MFENSFNSSEGKVSISLTKNGLETDDDHLLVFLNDNAAYSAQSSIYE